MAVTCTSNRFPGYPGLAPPSHQAIGRVVLVGLGAGGVTVTAGSGRAVWIGFELLVGTGEVPASRTEFAGAPLPTLEDTAGAAEWLVEDDLGTATDRIAPSNAQSASAK